MDNRIFSQLRRWVREGIVFILLALAVMDLGKRLNRPDLIEKAKNITLTMKMKRHLILI